jgi:hypothetical protein
MIRFLATAARHAIGRLQAAINVEMLGRAASITT